MLWQCSKQDLVKNLFLSDCRWGDSRVLISALLRRQEDLPCWPSHRTIGKVVGMSVNTVRKYVAILKERGLIVTKPMTVTTKFDGERRTPRVSGCAALCDRASAEAARNPPLSDASLYAHQRALARDEKKSRINAGRRKRPPPKQLLPAVRAVDGSFQGVKSGVYSSREKSV